MAANLRQITQKALSRRKFDAIVIGGGHNGLIAVCLIEVRLSICNQMQLSNVPVLELIC